ncbi:MAG: DUF72 domain-containing protein [Polyangiaceae bacterium]
MARILVGLAALTGDIRKVVDRFDLVEVRKSAGAWPREATLRRWRKDAKPAFVFAVVIPPEVATLADDVEAKESLAETLRVAAALEARVILLQTPADVRPTTANKKRIAAFFEKIPAEGTVRCWEPAGVWEPADVIATARAAKVLPVLDAAQEELPPGPIVFTRLRALGKAAASPRTIARLTSAVRGRREAFVVVEDPKEAAAVRAALPSSVAKVRSASSGPIIVRPSVAPLVAEDEEQ